MYREKDDTAAPHAGPQVTVRLADASDARALARLAALDSADVPPSPTLLAEEDGEPVAALPVGGGRAVADPFRRTAAMVELLELRAAQLRGRAGPGARAGSYAGRVRGLVRAPRALSLR